MKKIWSIIAVVLALGLLSILVRGLVSHQDRAGPPGATLLIIRHAEKPASNGGPGLSAAGEKRARNYADYFRKLQFEDKPLHIDFLVATADTPHSARPRLTLEPLSEATGLSIQQPFADEDVKGLTQWLAESSTDRTALIAWHHKKLPKLLRLLGADPNELLPGGEWPPDAYDWLIVLRYDKDGHITAAERVIEPALP